MQRSAHGECGDQGGRGASHETRPARRVSNRVASSAPPPCQIACACATPSSDRHPLCSRTESAQPRQFAGALNAPPRHPSRHR
eukprot:3583620-Rhodomonas_salina.1